jgi:hypothetical protein
MKIITLILLLTPLSLLAINLDGILDDVQWRDAQHFDEMVLVKPYVLTNAKYQTDIFVTSDEKGIYFGIKNFQPVDTRNTDTSARDQRIGSDKNQIIIDFDDNGIAAYSFEIGIGGSIRDGIFSNENNFSNEWDGNWSAKTSQNDEYWVSEVFIPWDVVSMKESTSDLRTLSWYVSRDVVDINEVYANIPTDNSRQRFMSEFSKLGIKDYAVSSFSLFGYATGRQDFHNQVTSSDIGLDLFWKSGNGKQLTATLNPDFGQIESDRLVVNFSATETFFNERRPFFTENQSLFDVQGANGLRLLHTRRIGARPDKGDAGVSDIDVAVKYTDNQDQITYGVLAAFESSGNGFEGRDYFAGRALHRSQKQSFGLTTAFVDRVDINRTATSMAFDHEYLFGQNIKFKSQIVAASTKQEDEKTNGMGGWLNIQHQINPNRSHYFEASHYDDDFEINDFGFLPRNNLNTFRYHHTIKQTEFNESVTTQQRIFNLDFFHQSNDSGDTISRAYQLSNTREFKNATSMEWQVRYKEKGVDDLISRGHGNLNTGSGYELRAIYRSSNANKFRYHGFYEYLNYFSEGKGSEVHLHPSYYFTDNYSVSLSVFYSDYDDWVNWEGDDLFGRYKRKLLNNSLDFNANISPKQELRMRFQWLAIDAQANKEYRLDSEGNLISTGNTINDFSLSNTALQIRYRYEIAPLSNIYIVYSRGGHVFEEVSNSIGSLFDSGLSNVTGNNFLVKIRYKFL